MLRRIIALSMLLGILALSSGCVVTGAGYYPYTYDGYYQGYYDPYYPYLYTPYVYYPYPFFLGGSVQFNVHQGGHGFHGHGGGHR